MKYRAEIDGLRAIAVLPVMLFHAGYGYFKGGYVGVDVFFVISGYLITSIILFEKEAGTFTLAGFYERRARRILPALVVVVLVCIPFAWVWMSPRDLKEFAASVLAVALFSSNVLFWKQSGYFDSAAELKPLLHTWSLAIEEQYYLFFPLLILLAWRYGRNAVVAIIAVLAIVSLALAQWGSASEPSATFYLLPTRAWELLTGALIAFYLASEVYAAKADTNRGRAAAEFWSALGIVLICYAVLVFDESTPFPSLLALVPTIGAGLIILFAQSHTFVGKLLATRTLVSLGLISYSAYLWHQPLLAFARLRSEQAPSGALRSALLAASLLLAYLTWATVETWFRNRKNLPRFIIFRASSAALVLMAAVGYMGYSNDGYQEARLNEHQRALLDTARASPKRSECHDGPAERNLHSASDACEYFGKHVSWAVFGDSHTVELAYALAEGLQKFDVGIKQFSFGGCYPAYNRDDRSARCWDWTHEAVEYILANDRLKTVVVSYWINGALFGDHRASYPDLPEDIAIAEREARWKAYVDVIEVFRRAGKQVVVVLQAPELKRRAQDLIFTSTTQAGAVTGNTRLWWEARNQYVRSRISQMPEDVVIVDPADLFCDSAYCYAARNGEALYFDDDHMSIAGAEKVTNEIFRLLALSQ